jgi:hypothetical protein
MARAFEAAFVKGNRSIQARFALPNALQTSAPASGGTPASGDVVLRRTGPRNEALIIEAGRMRLVFDVGVTVDEQGTREYTNASRVIWNPGDTADRTVRFAADANGFAGNLDFIANVDGTIDLGLVTIKDQDQNRAGVNASSLFTSQSVLQDTGTPDVFIPDDVGLYVRIDDSSTVANIGKVRRILGFEWPEVELPAGSGRYPGRVFLDDEQRRDFVEVLQDDGGAYTDVTPGTTTETQDTAAILPDPFIVGDAVYFGYVERFDGLEIDLTTAGVGTWDVVWEYWDGVAYVALDGLNDPTLGLKPAAGDGVYEIRWTQPTDWTSVVSPGGSGLTLFFVRARIDALTTLTTTPIAGRTVSLVPEPLDGIVAAGEALQDDGGAITDYTSEALSVISDDVPLLPAAPVTSDAFYFGLSSQFSSAILDITTAGDGVWDVVWEYWNGSAFVTLPGMNDGTNAFRNAGRVAASWVAPSDWETSASPLSATQLFFVRARVSGFTSIATQPFAATVRLGSIDDGTVTWTLLDFQEDDLGLEIVQAEAFTGGTDNDLYILGDNRGLYQQQGESDDVFRDRIARVPDSVSPNAILRVINRVLRPLGLKGQVCDVQPSGNGGGFHGLFLDTPEDLAPDFVSALDLYGSGDLFPGTDTMFLLQSSQEIYCWFLVKLPFIGVGDFGIFCDDGPLYFDSSAQVYLGPSMEGFCDGEPVDGYAAYRTIAAALDPIKAGGVGYTLLRQESLSTP